MHDHQLHGDAKTHEIITLYKFNAHKALGPHRRRRSARVHAQRAGVRRQAACTRVRERKVGASLHDVGRFGEHLLLEQEHQGRELQEQLHQSSPTSSSTKSTGSDHSQGNSGTSGTYNQPQPYSHADQNNTGANDTSASNQYKSTRDGSPSGNGNGDGKATGKPCAGCVGKADNKNPKGQFPNGTDHNNGYECDGNHGIGQDETRPTPVARRRRRLRRRPDVCPPGTTGTPPNCTPPTTCPPGTMGTYPICTPPTVCPPGTTGTPPNCTTPPPPPPTCALGRRDDGDASVCRQPGHAGK